MAFISCFAPGRPLLGALVASMAMAWGHGPAVAQPAPGPAEPIRVDLELVLAVDISGSIDEDESRLQREGYLNAIVHPEVIEAVRSGAFGRIAVTYVEWSGDDFQQTVVDWMLIEDEMSAQTFAGALSESPRQTGRWTSISTAIDRAVTLFEENGYEGTRRVVDVSGDGYNNRGRPVTISRDEAVSAGITINGLPILNERPSPGGGWPAAANLDTYYETQVIGGPGAFIIPAKGFEDFARAILAKLVLEVAGTPGPADTTVNLAFLPSAPPP